MAGLVISLDEVRRRNEIKTDTEAEKRIAKKEAIYLGLLGKEAKYSGKALEETLPKQQVRDEKIDSKYMDRFEEIASLKEIGIFEAQLDVRIERMEMLLEVMADPPPNFVNDLV